MGYIIVTSSLKGGKEGDDKTSKWQFIPESGSLTAEGVVETNSACAKGTCRVRVCDLVSFEIVSLGMMKDLGKKPGHLRPCTKSSALGWSALPPGLSDSTY